MCGIIGLFALGGPLSKKQEAIRQDVMIFLQTELMQLTQKRGEDATGAATLFRNSDFMILKMGVAAIKLIARMGGTEKDYDGFIKIWRENIHPAFAALAHCRKASVGNTWDNENNHPIKVDNTIGIHNGTLKNHHKIFRMLGTKRDGDVDSEAIISLLNHFCRNGSDLFTPDMLYEITRRIEGQYAVIAANANNPHQVALMRDGRPMEFALIKPLNLFVVASEREFINTVLFRLNKMSKFYGHSEIPFIGTTSVDFGMLLDDYVAVLDLSKKADDNSKIEDFLAKKDTKGSEKLWNNAQVTVPAAASTPTTPAATATTLDTSAPAGKTEVDASPVNSTTGKVFTENVGFSNVAAETINMRKKGTVFIDPDDANQDDSVVELDDDTAQLGGPDNLIEGDDSDAAENTDTDADGSEELRFRDAGENATSSLIDDANPINLVDIENPDAEPELNLEMDDSTLDEVIDSIEVTFDINAKAMEAGKAAAEELMRYETDADVSRDLEINPLTAINNMPKFAVANRVKKASYTMGFHDGFVAGEKGVKPHPDVPHKKGHLEARATEKLSSAEAKIRSLKTIALVLSQALEDTSTDKIDRAIAAAFGDNLDLKSEVLQSVFTTGDLKVNDRLYSIIGIVKDKESR